MEIRVRRSIYWGDEEGQEEASVGVKKKGKKKHLLEWKEG